MKLRKKSENKMSNLIKLVFCRRIQTFGILVHHVNLTVPEKNFQSLGMSCRNIISLQWIRAMS
ncbi:hypothetical protein HZS_5104 [Henneguya salminicola]|nr:hypothetical protein HZS_5104 [Henneguya salminicola]